MEEQNHIKSFCIRGGRISAAQQRCYTLLKDSFCLPLCDAQADYEKIFNNKNPVTIEIGFGAGLATAIIAKENPNNNYIGIEVFKAGIGKLLWRIEKDGLQNIRIIEGDAVTAIANMIQNNSINAFHIFFPDPWPKKRHCKRRLVQRPFTELLAAKLALNGYIYFVTDWSDYADYALGELSATSKIKNCYADFAVPQAWRPETRFEKKGKISGHEIKELMFKKIN
ncbi:MAG: tRNA (guanosine(46)-N7)-methyltransferase TrmB [Spirochaetaceae bacterium]|jgi:tRNA (guanine-N7-)-methyltransferase|nr:tRNA (guanosine(46)-N7)-methyltransferase TrmB [Spirochaetaceae bacterium]